MRQCYKNINSSSKYIYLVFFQSFIKICTLYTHLKFISYCDIIQGEVLIILLITTDFQTFYKKKSYVNLV